MRQKLDRLAVYNGNWELVGKITNHAGLTWVRRYQDVGEYSIKLLRTPENVALIKKGYILYKGTGGEAAFIENIYSDNYSGAETTFMVTGRFLSCILDWRECMKPVTAGVFSGAYSMSASQAIQQILADNFTAPSEAGRKMPDLLLGNMTTSHSPAVNVDYTSTSALDAVRELAAACGAGFRVVYLPSAKKYRFELYEGRQTDAVFSRKFKNITSQSYTRLTANMRTTCYMKQKDYTHVFGNSATGMNRREGHAISASNSPDPLDVQAAAWLHERQVKDSLDTVIDFNNHQFKYKADWDLGDIVRCGSEAWGVTLDKNVLEIAEYYELGGYNIAITFGDLPGGYAGRLI